MWGFGWAKAIAELLGIARDVINLSYDPKMAEKRKKLNIKKQVDEITEKSREFLEKNPSTRNDPDRSK